VRAIQLCFATKPVFLHVCSVVAERGEQLRLWTSHGLLEAHFGLILIELHMYPWHSMLYVTRT